MIRVREIVYPMVTFALLLLVWQFVTVYWEVKSYIVPAPTKIFAAIVNGWDIYVPNLLITLYSTFLAFTIALVFGVGFGILVSQINFLGKTLLPILVAMQSMPRIALAPVIIVWFGFGIASKVALGAFTAFFPIFLNTIQGMKAGDPEQMALMRSFKASRFQTLLKVKLPNALPFLLAGSNIGVVFAMLAVIVGEFLGANQGMGYLIVNQSAQMDTSAVFGTVFLLSGVGIAMHYLITGIGNRLFFWGSDTH